MRLNKNNQIHIPVLLTEVLGYLQVVPDNWYIDATAGFGGHTEKIIDQGGRVLAIEWDKDAVAFLEGKFTGEIKSRRLIIAKGNFIHVRRFSLKFGLPKIKGILFDLGMSTFQIKNSMKGFSFLKHEKLDMRMTEDIQTDAYTIINSSSLDELTFIFMKYGEERFALEIARDIVRIRKVKPIRYADELAEIVEKIYKSKHLRIEQHAATQIFQALRMYTNHELDNLKLALPDSYSLLDIGGRLVVISFHSLEDRMVKQHFQRFQKEHGALELTHKPIRARKEEIQRNPSARSAKLRVVGKNHSYEVKS